MAKTSTSSSSAKAKRASRTSTCSLRRGKKSRRLAVRGGALARLGEDVEGVKATLAALAVQVTDLATVNPANNDDGELYWMPGCGCPLSDGLANIDIEVKGEGKC